LSACEASAQSFPGRCRETRIPFVDSALGGRDDAPGNVQSAFATMKIIQAPSALCSRRQFVVAAAGAVLLAPTLLHAASGTGKTAMRRLQPCGPGSKYAPRIHAAFVRRKGDYGMRWPGAIYDGEAAARDYRRQLLKAEKELGLQVTLRPEPIFSAAEADAWLAEARAAKPDGLLVMLLDRQEHAWPTATKAAESGIPTVVFSPVGTSFTTNTAPLAAKEGVFIASTSDFAQAHYGLKMLRAAAKLREMRYLVIRGAQRFDTETAHFGTKLRYVPAKSFLDEYQQTPTDDEIRQMAAAYRRSATRVTGASPDDLVHGIKSYVVARRLLEREEADAITMDCLGALGESKVSLPCIAWSRMNDDGIPAACEADIGACLTHALVQLLFDRPGFQQDPVAETARQCLIGAHCSCPTRLKGFDQPPEPFHIAHHHGNRDAVPITKWRLGQRVTIADVLLPKENGIPEPRLVIGTGAVVENVPVPPHGGCVVSVMLKLDTQPDLLSYPGFHQLFFYGDFKQELTAFAKLFRVQPVVA
jgi:hypothetical protein